MKRRDLLQGGTLVLLLWVLAVAIGGSFFDGVNWLFGVLLFMFMHTSAMMPMSEAAMAHLVTRDGVFDARRYGRVRLWGSLGFLVTVVVADMVGCESREGESVARTTCAASIRLHKSLLRVNSKLLM